MPPRGVRLWKVTPKGFWFTVGGMKRPIWRKRLPVYVRGKLVYNKYDRKGRRTDQFELKPRTRKRSKK